MVQVRAAIYCRVSTADQNCDYQTRELREYANRCGYEVIDVVEETASGAKNDRAGRKAIMELARKRLIDTVLVSELSRWGRSTQDLLVTLKTLQEWNVNVQAVNGPQLDFKSPMGEMVTTILAAVAQFERDLIRQRVRSGLANAKARGKKLGRQPGQNPSDKYATLVLQHLADGRTYRWIAHEMQISKTTVQAIADRHNFPRKRRLHSA
jgi:DNA invertase Pin-like site-specific DNA recombinase